MDVAEDAGLVAVPDGELGGGSGPGGGEGRPQVVEDEVHLHVSLPEVVVCAVEGGEGGEGHGGREAKEG